MKKRGGSTGSPPRLCRGFAIILVLATLVLLAMLSLTYIKLALIDRNIARNYMDNKRAKLIAQSGVDYAIAKLQEDQYGTTWQQTKVIKINGVDTNYTESSGSTYGENRDIFKVEARDCQSMINVNDGLDNDRVKENTKRMLKALGDVVGVADLGNKIIDNRPVQGYTSKQELLKYLTQDEFKQIKDLVTTHAWQDPNVANPVPLSSAVLEKYIEFNDGYTDYDAAIGVYRYGRGKDSSEALLSGELMFAPDYVTNIVGGLSVVRPEYIKYAIYALDELNPQWIEITSRSPVNINLADEGIIKVLLKDLKGIFVNERRSVYPRYFDPYSPIYNALGDYHNYGYNGSAVIDELGFLYSTQSIEYNIAMDNGLAKDIADHIKGCRDKQVVTTGPLTIDYTDTGSLWFRGPFKSWRQFNAFVDNLVKEDPGLNTSVIQDTRDLSEYNMPEAPWAIGEISLHGLVLASSSSPVKKIASQARADVLKANFNPNLHLNETNPDANIAILIDKTDLIVNSTEFCFTPMGYFEIESAGYILRESGLDNIIIAEQKINSVVQLYDCYRETNQKQFLNHINNLTDYENYIGQESTPIRTNNMRTIQIGPEPEHIFDGTSPIAKANEWGGYISLPTMKGSPDAAATLYSNFTNNFTADYHADGLNSNITTYNSADPTELKPDGVAEPAGRGSYEYSSRNRLSRSFRRGDTIDPKYYAVCDLRIDGAYIERHASVVYDVVTHVYEKIQGKDVLVDAYSNVMKSPGFWSYWVKPWFHPESAGKARTFVSFSKYIGPNYDDVLIFASWSFASHGISEDKETAPSNYGAGRIYYYKSSTLVFGHSNTSETEIVDLGGRGISSPTLNHIYHSDNKTTYMKSGHWTHVTCYWDLGSTSGPDQINLLVNGEELSANFLLGSHSGTAALGIFWENSKRIRLGEPIVTTAVEISGKSETTLTADDPKRNWTADATLDEFYIFSGTKDDLTKATNIYFSSRYYKLSPNPSYFISQELQLITTDKTPSYSTITDPDGSIASSGDLVDKKTRIIGLSWTWYAETIDKAGKPVLKNYKDYKLTADYIVEEIVLDPATSDANKVLFPEIKVQLIRNSGKPDEYKSTEFTDSAYSSVDLDLSSSNTIQYKTLIDIPSVPLNTVLLYTPIFDDITIYYTSGVKFLSYSYFE